MYVFVCLYVSVCVYVCMYVYACMHVCMLYMCVWNVCVYGVCMHVMYVYICIYVMYVCMVCMYVCALSQHLPSDHLPSHGPPFLSTVEPLRGASLTSTVFIPVPLTPTLDILETRHL